MKMTPLGKVHGLAWRLLITYVCIFLNSFVIVNPMYVVLMSVDAFQQSVERFLQRLQIPFRQMVHCR